ncbi:hypothetical protein [Psychrobacillus psychrotolerans]|uniref:hypothetical protein n=1 Tax=Psychrobacillus psychrotolerans TaxID=126156 RepID=UPI003C782334
MKKPSLGDYGISVDFDSTSFSLKLKAIAKHAEELANELDAIDAESLEKESTNTEEV